jgi:hypothetical protein
MRRDGQTEIAKLIVAFPNFANAPRNVWASLNFDGTPMMFNNADL